MDHFPFAELTGDNYTIGRLHGSRFSAAVRVQLDETLAGALQSGLDRPAALRWADGQLPRIAALAPHWIDELRGLADGAGLSLDEVVALQVRPGSGALPERAASDQVALAEGCTSFAVAGDATADGRPLSGQNRDLVPAYRRRMVVLLLRPIGRTPILMHAVPGELGGVGLNGRGVSVWANSIWAREGRNWQAPPLLRRAMLECGTADEAADRARAMDGPAVGSFLISDAAGRVRNLESLPQGLEVIAQDGGAYAHANHCTAARLLPHEAPATPTPGSRPRQACLEASLATFGPLTVDCLKSLLASHEPRAEPVCRHSHDERVMETAACTIAEPAALRLHISHGPPCEGRWRTYSIDG
jgi:isopenicillin-N N-acyltransferase-like protein